jgi:DNA-binding transcriptional ArsR family regulator
MSILDASEQLRAYTALDNWTRLRAVWSIMNAPEISFNNLARRLKIERSLLGYHLGVLKAAGLIRVEHKRRRKDTSQYHLSQDCVKLLNKLSA